MTFLIYLTKGLLVLLIGISAKRIKTLSSIDANRRKSEFLIARRKSARQFRSVQEQRGLSKATPTELIDEYIDSLLSDRPIIAGSNIQIQRWIRPQGVINRAKIQTNPAASKPAADNQEEWIYVETASENRDQRIASFLEHRARKYGIQH